jgi:hypothetical protein
VYSMSAAILQVYSEAGRRQPIFCRPPRSHTSWKQAADPPSSPCKVLVRTRADIDADTGTAAALFRFVQ